MCSTIPKKYNTIRIGDTIIFVCATIAALVSGAAAVYITGTLVAMYIPIFLSTLGLTVLGIVSWVIFCLFVIIAVYCKGEIKNSKRQNRRHPLTGEAYDFCLRKALDDVAKKMKRPGQ